MAPTCSYCHDLALPHLDIPATDLLQGILAGCDACQLVGEAVSRLTTLGDGILLRIYVDCALYISVSEGNEKDGTLQAICLVELYTEKGAPCLWQNIGPARKVETSSISAGSLTLMRHWLKDCQERHPSCRGTTTGKSKLPARVIDVGDPMANGLPQVSLYITKGEEGSYTALSHCWGGGKPLSTTKSSIADHEKLITFDAASTTFAQAAEVTRALGIRYLWIDSLCIVQDDSNDWEAEAAKMTQIYRHATVTISADGAVDASKGLYCEPGARISAHNTISISTLGPNGEPAVVYARLRSYSSTVHTTGTPPNTTTIFAQPLSPSDPDSAPHSSLLTSPSKLSTRAWVVQERILSPRIIHFYKEELVWSCQGIQRCECRLLAGASSPGSFRGLLSATPLPTLPSFASPDQAQNQAILQWPALVSEFTAKEITYAKDRLPAISGLAALVQSRVCSLSAPKYLAGHWSTDLEYSLLWYIKPTLPPTPARRVASTLTAHCGPSYYAPSWSWASLTGPVHFPPRHQDQYTHRRTGGDEIQPVWKVLSASAIPSTANSYGPVKPGASITIQGQVRPLIRDSGRRVWRPVMTEHLQFGQFGEVYQVRAYDAAVDAKIRNESDEPCFYWDEGTVTFTRDELERIVLLRAATHIIAGVFSSPRLEVVALCLLRVEGQGGEVFYERKGLVLQAFDREVVWEGAEMKTVTIV